MKKKKKRREEKRRDEESGEEKIREEKGREGEGREGKGSADLVVVQANGVVGQRDRKCGRRVHIEAVVIAILMQRK
jgi:hypothetical protein